MENVDYKRIVDEISIVVRRDYLSDKEAVWEIVEILSRSGVNCGCRKMPPQFYVIREHGE